MSHRFDESELLALIEDQLDPARAAALSRELATDPLLRTRIEAMRADRVALRGAPEPVAPADLQLDIERIVARPALVETSATAWRRRHMRHHHWQWALAAAAVIVMAASASIWIVLRPTATLTSGVLRTDADTFSGGDGGAELARADAPDATPRTSGLDRQTPNPIAHPSQPFAGTPLAQGPVASPSGIAAGAAGAPQLVASPFAVVIRAAERDEALATLRRIVQESATETALVKNLTFHEVEELQRLAAANSAQPGSPAAASAARSETRGAAIKPPAIAGRQGSESLQPPQLDRSKLSGVLAGSRDLAAPPEQQLAFSDGGAELTLSVPVAQLPQMLERLQQAHGTSTSLRSLVTPGSSAAAASTSSVPPASPESAWLSQVAALQARLRELRQADPRSVVLIPIVVEPPAARPAPRR